MKLLFKILKKIIISSFLIYIYNYVAIKFDLIIPINFINISIVSLFGGFGLIGLVLFKYFIMWGFYGRDVLC